MATTANRGVRGITTSGAAGGRLRLTPWTLDRQGPESPADHTLFALANGCIGLRGDGNSDGDQAYVNGFYETWPITYPEDAYGLARVGQTIQPAPYPGRFTLRVNGRESGMPDTARTTLDFRTGVVRREATWAGEAATPAVRVESTRLVSLAERGCALLEYAVTVSEAADVEVGHWLLAPRTGVATGPHDPRRSTALGDALRTTWRAAGDTLEMVVRAANSGLGAACVVAHQVETREPPTYCFTRSSGQDPGPREPPTKWLPLPQGEMAGDDPVRRVSAHLAAGERLTVTALVAYATDGPLLDDHTHPATDADLLATARAAIAAVDKHEWSALYQAQARVLADWWAAADVEVDLAQPQDSLQGAIRWHLFQTLQATACAAGRGLPAKGLTGGGYDGHTFWDAEAMVLPVLTYTQPGLARRALSYRHATLPRARERAAELHHAGALFPWRGIDGREASAFFEAGTAQYHINADIAYAVNRYLAATGDMAYLAAEGIDLLAETARFWVDLGFYGDDGAFHLHGVTGPDEYSALVDDNLYTNVMAAANLEAAACWLARLRDHDHTAWAAARDRLDLHDDEPAEWVRAARAVTIVFDEARGLHGQDQRFLHRERWDFEHTPATMYPLLLHFHPLTIYRHQVLKQADLVLALINRPDLFTPEQMRADFDYYDAITTGDSTLSLSPQAIMAARVGHLGLAESYFRQGLGTDLANTHGNTTDGVHVAAAGATWATLVLGFGGFRDYSGWYLDPGLPPGWARLAFSLRLAGSVVGVEITPDDVALTLVSGPPVTLVVRGRPVTAGRT
ncbi:MAG: glycoside hydrolase family 65 protein [Propionibacteriaceae bacterium]|jgi:alpha,alpha-trehalose phosphorylase|nr:glycoside hydrolase family 65 protein [Propionibacteriaceae bacterium]